MLNPDDRDRELLARRIRHRDERLPLPSVGDWVREADGRETRITHVWEGCADDGGDHIQAGGGAHGSFYLSRQGYADYSGGLDPGFPGSQLTLIEGETKPGSVWFFHHDFPAAHSGVTFQIQERVWRRSVAA